MASNYKSTKTQLIAIYKLEFYKNKKNWKLYEDVRKEPPSPEKTTNKLNKTYNIGEVFPEPEYDAELVSQHNKAFLHEEPDDGPDPQPPDCALPDLPAPDHNLYRPRSWPAQPWDGDETEALWQDTEQEWCGAKAEGIPEELAYVQCDGPCHQHNLWTPASHFELKPAADPLDLQAEYLSSSQVLHTAEEWLQRHGYPVQQEEYAPTYDDFSLADDSADFERGAHEAPHSSEIDLSITQECGCVCGGEARALSSRQLALGLRAHHAALALLLRERAARDRLSSCSQLHPPIPFEDYPTRDTDPLRPPDCVLSGSHLALSGSQLALSGSQLALSGSQLALDAGRGRGRLQQTHRLIGIGMGRPFRL